MIPAASLFKTPYNPHRLYEAKGLSWWTPPLGVRMCVAMDEHS
jgi:hypothetical protein